jgi:hypothetical protein
MDEITPVKTKFRMEQWIQLIKDQRSSGMSVKAWCQQTQIKNTCLMCLSIEKFSVWSRKVVHLPTHFYSVADGRPISFLSEYHLHNF